MAIKYKWLVEQLREIIQILFKIGINKLPTETGRLACQIPCQPTDSSGGAGSSGGREGNSPH